MRGTKATPVCLPSLIRAHSVLFYGFLDSPSLQNQEDYINGLKKVTAHTGQISVFTVHVCRSVCFTTIRSQGCLCNNSNAFSGTISKTSLLVFRLLGWIIKHHLAKCNYSFFKPYINVGCVKRKRAKWTDLRHPAHAQSLIRVLALHWNIL